MTTYIALFSLTEAGIKAAKDSPRRLDAAKKLLADMGGEMKQFYMVMGDCDFVGICEAPDDAVMARYVLQLGGLGFVRTKTLKAFPETAYREIIRSLANQRSSRAWNELLMDDGRADTAVVVVVQVAPAHSNRHDVDQRLTWTARAD